MGLRMLRWPIAEVLLRYLDVARREQLDHYRHRMLMFAIQRAYAKKDMQVPMAPPLLRADAEDAGGE